MDLDTQNRIVYLLEDILTELRDLNKSESEKRAEHLVRAMYDTP